MKKEEILTEINQIYEESKLISLFYTIVSLYAAFLCFKKNKGVTWYIIPALMFSPLYIVYVFATKDKNFNMNPFK